MGDGESRREVHPASDDLDVARRFARGGQWNPLKATLVPTWRGGTSLAGLDRETTMKPLLVCSFVLPKMPQRDTNTEGRGIPELPGITGRSVVW